MTLYSTNERILKQKARLNWNKPAFCVILKIYTNDGEKDIINFKNMYRFGFIIIASVITFLTTCNTKATNTNEKENNQQVPDYIINKNLSSKGYMSHIKGYFPKKGLVPTAKIAFQIAEPILNQIYGSENIEAEKPFSINLENDVWIIEGHFLAFVGI